MIARSAAPAAVLLLLTVVLAPPAQGQTTLRWKFEKGQKLHYVLTQETEISVGVMGRKIESNQHQTIDMTWHIVELQDDGSARMTQTIDRMQLTVKAQGLEVKFDSKDPAAAPPQLAPLANLTKALVGQEIGLTMNPRGEVKDVEVPEKVLGSLKGVGQAAGGLLSEDGIKNLTSQGSLVFPEEALTPGKTWKKGQKITTPQIGTMTIDTTYTFQGPAEGSQAGVQKIDAEPVLKLESSLDIDVKSQDNEASFLFDNKEGVLRSSQVRQAITMGGQIMGQDFSQEMKTSVSLKLADGAPTR